MRAGLQRARPVNASSRRAGRAVCLRPRISGQSPSRSRSARGRVFPESGGDVARAEVSDRRQWLGGQGHASERPAHRPPVHRRSQRLQLHAARGAEHQPREHGPLRLLAGHARFRSSRRRRLHDHRSLGRHRTVPGARPRVSGGARWRGGGGAAAGPFAGAGERDWRRGSRANSRRAYLCAPGGAAGRIAQPARRDQRFRRGGRVMKADRMRFVFCGLSITSSWGNGHATTYRALVRELVALGHDVLFLERDVPWYASNRDLPEPPWGRTALYGSLEELKDRFARSVRNADVVVVGSYVPDGVAVGEWVTRTARGVTAFYDIDTPVTLAKLARGDEEYLSPALIAKYQLYFSFTGGPTLRFLERRYGSPRARVLYCSVDPEVYYPEPEARVKWDLGYLGTYGEDRQPRLNALLVEPARKWPRGRFAVAGPLYPANLRWPRNVDRTDHLPPSEHRAFYNSQRYTLNVTRADMVRAGYSPSVRLFEAAACGVPIVSDIWPGIEQFFEPGKEIRLVRNRDDVLACLQMSEDERREIAERGRCRTLKCNTAAVRAGEFEYFAEGVITGAGASRRVGAR